MLGIRSEKMARNLVCLTGFAVRGCFPFSCHTKFCTLCGSTGRRRCGRIQFWEACGLTAIFGHFGPTIAKRIRTTLYTTSQKQNVLL